MTRTGILGGVERDLGSAYGVPALDHMLESVGYAEFYGEWTHVRLLAHRYIAHNPGCRVILTQEFGGLNPYLVETMAQRMGVAAHFQLRRSFSLETTIDLVLQAAEEDMDSPVVVLDPYLYSPSDWRMYPKLTRLVGALRRLAQAAPLVVFNRPSRFAARLPEGGHFNRSSSQALFRVSGCAGRVGIHVNTMKHPARPREWTCIPYTEIYGYGDYATWRKWGAQRLLLEWL